MSSEPSRYLRREFLGQCAAIPLAASLATAGEPAATNPPTPTGEALTVPKMPEAQLAKEVKSLFTLVDPQLVHRYVPLPPEQNAWPLLKQAGEVYIEEPAGEEFEEGLEKFLAGKPAQPVVQERILEWLKQNDDCRKLTDQALERGGIELPRAAKSLQLELAMDEIGLFRKLAYLKAVASCAALSRGDGNEALAEAIGVLKFGRQLMNAECLVVDQLVAQAVSGLGSHATFRAAMSAHVSRQQAIQAVQSLVAARTTVEDFKRALRVEYCRWFLPLVATFPDQATPVQLAKHYVLAGLSPDDQDDQKFTEPQRQDFDRRTRLLTAILEGHSKPFDKSATVRLSSDVHVRLFQELEKPWLRLQSDLLKTIRNETSAWPDEVEPEPWFILDPSENPNPRRELTRQDIRRKRGALAKVDNLVGKRLIEQQMSTVVSAPIIERHQAYVDSARLRITLRIYEREHGRLPDRLDDLIEAGLLPNAPLDPYDGKPFKYSAQRRVIWCVGQEGKNEGVIPETVDDELPFDQDFELTWQIEKV